MEGSDKPGMFVSFESLLRDLSGKMDDMQKAVLDEIGKLRTEVQQKASKEHVDAVESRLKSMITALETQLDKQGDEIVVLRIGEGTAKGVSTTTLILGSCVIAGIFGIIAALIYVVKAHGG